MAVNNQQPKDIDSILNYLLAPATPQVSFYDRFRQRRLLPRLLCIGFGGILALTFVCYAVWWKAPPKFPAGVFVAVTEGMTVSEVSTLLADIQAVRSQFWFKTWSVLLGGNKGIRAGEYYFSAPLSVFELARRLTRGIQNVVPARITIPEGLNNREIVALLAKSLRNFDQKRFLSLAKDSEGYLFPDTYVFAPSSTAEKVIGEMQKNFKKRIASLEEDIAASGKTLSEIITMASLIEGEARLSETRKQISGILWNRFELGMPLQVDAVFPYIMGKNTYEVTAGDLQHDSPYNTYLYAGLPPGPINNPSLDSIEAALHPAATKYLYYLTDKEGTMRYATTHAQHLVNRAKYLGK